MLAPIRSRLQPGADFLLCCYQIVPICMIWFLGLKTESFSVFNCIRNINKPYCSIVIFKYNFFYFFKIDPEKFFSWIDFVDTLGIKILMQDCFKARCIIRKNHRVDIKGKGN